MTKKLTEVRIDKADGTGIRYTAAEDGLTNATLTESNVLIIFAPEPIAMFSPIVWVQVFSEYEEVPDAPKSPGESALDSARARAAAASKIPFRGRVA